MAHSTKVRYKAPMQPPWSKLQRAVYLIVAPGLPLQIHCRVYPMNAQYGQTGIPRYRITLGKEVIWDHPKEFVSRGYLDRQLPSQWPYATDISEISCVIREYLETPRSLLLAEPFATICGVLSIFFGPQIAASAADNGMS